MWCCRAGAPAGEGEDQAVRVTNQRDPSYLDVLPQPRVKRYDPWSTNSSRILVGCMLGAKKFHFLGRGSTVVSEQLLVVLDSGQCACDAYRVKG